VTTRVCACALLLAACGYTAGSGLHEHGIRTVQVLAVANDTYRQRLEEELGAEVSRTLARTDLLPGDSSADAVLELRILDERERTLVTGDRTVPVREGAQEVLVQVRLRDRRSGRLVVDRTVADRAEFRDPIGENLTTARQQLVRDLASKIVLALETGF
jgi:hypothetical protein